MRHAATIRQILTTVLVLGCLPGTLFSQSSRARPYDQIARLSRDVATAPKKAQPYQDSAIRYDIYRDRNPYPIDPRKPCQVCTTRSGANKWTPRLNQVTGYEGRPFKEREPGGCTCGKKQGQFRRPHVNVYWPSPTAGVAEHLFPNRSAQRAANFDRFRLANIYDHLGGFEVSRYQRSDNGYCGPGRDPYGCLGESRQIPTNVFGVGLREPGQPIERGGVVYP